MNWALEIKVNNFHWWKQKVIPQKAIVRVVNVTLSVHKQVCFPNTGLLAQRKNAWKMFGSNLDNIRKRVVKN